MVEEYGAIFETDVLIYSNLFLLNLSVNLKINEKVMKKRKRDTYLAEYDNCGINQEKIFWKSEIKR